MDLNLSDEQRLLRESAERFVAESYDADHRRKTANDPLGFSPAVWKQFAELGWLALPIPEEFDGLGGGPVEIGILMEAFGRGLVSEPYIATVVLGAALIDECGSTAQKQASLPKIADGSLKLAFAHSERARAVRSRQGRDISPQDGARLASFRQQDRGARRPCRRRDHRLRAYCMIIRGRRGGSACFWCRQRRRGVAISDYERLGGGRACNIELSDVQLPEDALLGDGKDALPAIEWAVDRAMAALGAEAVGIMQTLLDTTLDYTKIRKQFGRPLSANQVIRHRLADMAMQVDEAALDGAARGAEGRQPRRSSARRAASAAKAKIGKCARFVGEQSIQLHGGMGVTEELEVGAYFKRLVAFDTLFGGSAHHYGRHAQLGRTTQPA